jgi:hypothetical protein
MRNNKGFTGVELAIILAICGLIGWVVIPPTINSLGKVGIGGDKNQSKATYKAIGERPTFYQDEAGNFVYAGIEKYNVSSSNMIAEQPKQTLAEKLSAIPKIIIILGILGLIFPPFGIWLITQLIRMKNNFIQVVNGIEEAKKTLPKESVDILATNLSRKMDSAAKTLVKQAKVKLPS